MLTTLPAAFWVMAACALIADARPFVTATAIRQGMVVFPSICFTFAIMLEWGLLAGVVVQVGAVLVAMLRLRFGLRSVIFHAVLQCAALAAAEAVLHLAGSGTGHLLEQVPVTWADVVATVAAAGAWFVVIYSVVLVRMRVVEGPRRWPTHRSTLGYQAFTSLALVLLSPVMVAASRAGVALIPLVLLPLLAVYRMPRLSAEREQLVRRDSLTGLANRGSLLREVVAQASAHTRRAEEGRPDHHFALLVLDLDRFKHVNEALGHVVGDRLLVEVGRRLTRAVPEGGAVARLGGDEFAVLACGLTGPEQALELAGELSAALADPVYLDGLPLDVGGAIGIAVYPDHGEDFATLMRHADVAMYEAKHGGDGTAVYTPEADQNTAERLALLADLRQALSVPGGDEITMFYQPQIDIDSGELVGVEALLRWRHPRRGLVDPEEVIRVAERTAVMRMLTRRVVDDVVEQVAKWRAAGLRVRASLNVSVRDLHTSEVADRIADRLAHFQVDPDQLQLEITEGALMADPRKVMSTIAQLDRIGVAIALDDFGTGYSSMQHLRRLPLTEVKIDRSFVLGMVDDADDAAIVRSIIELSSALGLRVVAEGVEDERTWRMLARTGCHVAQGWFHARPMPAEDLVSWMARYRPVSPAGRRAGPSAPAG